MSGLAESSGDTAVIVTLVGAIISLVGVIVWAVKFGLSKLFGSDGKNGAWGRLLDKFDGLQGDLKKNTETLERVQEAQVESTRVLLRLVEREPPGLIGEQTQTRLRKPGT